MNERNFQFRLNAGYQPAIRRTASPRYDDLPPSQEIINAFSINRTGRLVDCSADWQSAVWRAASPPPMRDRIVALTSLIIGFVMFAGCGSHDEPSVSKPNPPTATVRVETVEAKTHIATEEIIGTVRAKLRATIEAKIAGRIAEMHAVPGQQVTRGELLARLDAQEIRAKLDQALAVRQQAESDFGRFTALLDRAAATQAEFEAVQTRFRVADAAVTEAHTMLGYADVVAPFNGVVTRKLADVGDLAAPGKPLIEIEDPEHLRLEADIPEAITGTVELGASMRVRLSNIAGNRQGVVSEIAPTADPNSRTLRVKLDLQPEAGLRAGQFGRVAVPVREVLALRAPASSLVRRGQLNMVFVVENDRAVMRLVKGGKRIGEEIEIASGLSPGETVVIDEAGSLLDGQPVRVR